MKRLVLLLLVVLAAFASANHIRCADTTTSSSVAEFSCDIDARHETLEVCVQDICQMITGLKTLTLSANDIPDGVSDVEITINGPTTDESVRIDVARSDKAFLFRDIRYPDSADYGVLTNITFTVQRIRDIATHDITILLENRTVFSPEDISLNEYQIGVESRLLGKPLLLELVYLDDSGDEHRVAQPIEIELHRPSFFERVWLYIRSLF